MAPNFAVLIAAAGKSMRMGSHKALMRVGSRTALKASAQILASVKNSSIFVTLPPSLMVSLSDEDCAFTRRVSNRYEHLGYFGSIKSVLEQLNQTVQGIFILPVDAPIFDRRLLWAMVNLASAHAGPTIMVPYCDVMPGHPVYLSHHFFDGMKAWHGAHGLRAFIAKHKSFERALFWPDRRLLANHNYLNDAGCGVKPVCKIGDAAAIDAPS